MFVLVLQTVAFVLQCKEQKLPVQRLHECSSYVEMLTQHSRKCRSQEALSKPPFKKWKMRGSVETKPRSGRPTKISATTAREIVRDAKRYPQNSLVEIQAL